MEKHYLSPLFSPQSVIVFAGPTDTPEAMTPLARTLVASLKSQEFSGTLRFLDIRSSGTLADLAQARADLAIIKERDPAARGTLEILLCYPGLHALTLHAHTGRTHQSRDARDRTTRSALRVP